MSCIPDHPKYALVTSLGDWGALIPSSITSIKDELRRVSCYHITPNLQYKSVYPTPSETDVDESPIEWNTSVERGGQDVDVSRIESQSRDVQGRGDRPLPELDQSKTAYNSDASRWTLSEQHSSENNAPLSWPGNGATVVRPDSIDLYPIEI